MGKSSVSCLKIITCGASGDSTDDENLPAAAVEGKASSDKWRWSFRKRSTEQQILSNNMSFGPIPIGYNTEKKETLEDNFGSPIDMLIPGKEHAQDGFNDKVELSSSVVDPEMGDMPINSDLIGSAAFVIQSAIRGFMVRRELNRLKGVVKLQAAVRGHLVRNQAVGTLHCIFAIVKMQTIIRARRARRLADRESENHTVNNQGAPFPEKRNIHPQSYNGYASVKKLLCNGFVRQLLESTSKTNFIRAKCDSSQTDSTWKWFERWMAVMSSDIEITNELSTQQYSKEQKEIMNMDVSSTGTQASAASMLTNRDSEVIHIESVKSTCSHGEFITRTSGNNESDDLLRKEYEERSQFEVDDLCTVSEDIEKNSCSSGLLNVGSNSLMDSNTDKLGINDIVMNNAKKQPSTLSETEVKSSSDGSKKTCNPSFVAAQSKFQELSSYQALGRNSKASSKETSIASKVDDFSPCADYSLMKNEACSIIEKSESQSRVQVGPWECCTENCFSSKLDSPDRSEAEVGEIVHEIGSLEKTKHRNGIIDIASNHENTSCQVREPEFHWSQEQEYGHDTSTSSVDNVASFNEENPAERVVPEIYVETESATEKKAYLSPEISPRSHTTVLESHETPSSFLSIDVKPMKRKKDDTLYSRKQTSEAVIEKSMAHQNVDSSGSSIEQLQKDAKNGKRRNSFGVTKLDHVDNEPRNSNSNPLPSYMKATESARAKALANISPKSSPDVNDEDSYLKKRHSLPMAKQGSSPRMQRSTSKVKGNGNHSPPNSSERKWQR